jgi:hypothetical protein
MLELLECVAAGPIRSWRQKEHRRRVSLLGVGTVKNELPVVAKAFEGVLRKFHDDPRRTMCLLAWELSAPSTSDLMVAADQILESHPDGINNTATTFFMFALALKT